MKPATKSKLKLLAVLAALCTSSACSHNEETLRSVSDFCLSDKPLSVSAAPAAGVDDPGNLYDTDSTLLQVFTHNAVFHSLCPVAPNP